jgi:hypothetical protein
MMNRRSWFVFVRLGPEKLFPLFIQARKTLSFTHHAMACWVVFLIIILKKKTIVPHTQNSYPSSLLLRALAALVVLSHLP